MTIDTYQDNKGKTRYTLDLSGAEFYELWRFVCTGHYYNRKLTKLAVVVHDAVEQAMDNS